MKYFLALLLAVVSVTSYAQVKQTEEVKGSQLDHVYLYTPFGNVTYMCNINPFRIAVFDSNKFTATECDVVKIDHTSIPATPNKIPLAEVKIRRYDGQLIYNNCRLVYHIIDPTSEPFEKTYTEIDCRFYFNN